VILLRPKITTGRTTAADFVEITARQARIKARAELEEMGREWVREVVAIVSAELPRRDGARHKTNTTHLENSFDWRIEEGPDNGFPMRLALTIKPGVSKAKIAALEFGVQREYVIPGAGRTVPLRWGDAAGDLSKEAAFSGQVTWKPTGRINQGYRFMRRARERVVRRRRNNR
jgi:hypothetical protein